MEKWVRDYLDGRGITNDRIQNMSEIELMHLSRDLEYEHCRNDIAYYVRTYCVYEDKDADELIQPFNMWDAQEEALKSIHEHRRNIILKARQLGITWLVISYASSVLLLRSGRTVIGLSRTEDEAGELIRRLAVEFDNMPQLIRHKKNADGWNGITFENLAMSLTVYHPNGQQSVFKAFPSSPSSVRSFTADLLIFDEWAYQQWAEQIWTSALPAVNRPDGGKFIGLSTNQRGTLFETKFTEKDNGFNKIFIPWNADPRRDEEWYEQTRLDMGGDITQEYPATVEEALSVAGGAFFPEVTRQTFLTNKPLEGNLKRYVAFDYGFDMFACYWIQIDSSYHAQIYREYYEPNLNAMQAADIVRDLSSGEGIELFLAPPDLWNRQSATGKSTADVFHEHGVDLVKVDNNLFNGCMRIKEWVYAKEGEQSRLTILDNCAPNLFNSITKIQVDKNKPNVYAKMPHNLTHAVDGIRYFCVYWTLPADIISNKSTRKWTEDMWEDYKNANESDKRLLIERWGEPK
jgi:hypothetical protein